MRIELKCACGASAMFEASTFINGGGAPDACGRIFRVEVLADEWKEPHKDHVSPSVPSGRLENTLNSVV